jgi:two-component system response regulator YesN
MSYTILLVDDDREFTEEFKESFDDYDVMTAPNGDEAIGILKNPNSIDLVFLDVMMPGLRGTEVLKKVKQLEPAMPIIIITGYSSKDVAVEALRAHADDYVEKPLNLDRTRMLIKRYLESRYHDNGETGIIEKVKFFAERNFQKNVSLQEAADSVCLSPKYLSRLFKKSTGTGFNEYKLHLKIEKAKEFLTGTAFTVNQIADKLGYQNAESFVRVFKKITKNTPIEFRTKNKK